MIFFLLGALALGGFAAYELSAKTHTFVDDHVKAISDALAAHRAGDAHLDQAQAAMDVHAAIQPPGSPPAAHAPAGSVGPVELIQHAWDSLKAAQQATAAAAAHTITALTTAKTDVQMAAATQSAVAVDAKQKRIAAALAQLGAGTCGVRSYRVTAALKDALLARLHAEGMIVTGDNPWDVDTQQADVHLRAVWDPQAQILKLIVTSSAWYASCDAIWAKLEPVLKEILGV